VLRAVTDCVGVYGTAPTCYLSLLARIDGFELAHLDRALYVDRTLLRVRAQRYSVHMLTRADTTLVLSAVSAVHRKAVEKIVTATLGDDYPVWAPRIEQVLRDGPMPKAAVRAALNPPDRRVATSLKYAISLLAAEGRVVRTTVDGGWRSDRHAYSLWSGWAPGLDPFGMDPHAARVELARRYVGAYGPTTERDFRWWTGLRASESKPAWAEAGFPLAGPAGERRSTALDVGVRLLPVWDVLMVSRKDRSRLASPEQLDMLYDRLGNATSVVLVDGRPAGVWDLGRDDRDLRVKVAMFEPPGAEVRDGLSRQVRRIATLIAARGWELGLCGRPPVLRTAPKNRFLRPLAMVEPSSRVTS